MTIYSSIDIALLLVILLCAGDALRQMTPLKEPVTSAAFVLASVGAFGWIDYDIHGMPVHWWSISLHAGFAIYAAQVLRSRIRQLLTSRINP